MTTETLAISIGQVIVLGGYFFWLLRKHSDKIDQISIDVAVIKATMQNCGKRHETLARLDREVVALKTKLCDNLNIT